MPRSKSLGRLSQAHEEVVPEHEEDSQAKLSGVGAGSPVRRILTAFRKLGDYEQKDERELDHGSCLEVIDVIAPLVAKVAVGLEKEPNAIKDVVEFVNALKLATHYMPCR